MALSKILRWLLPADVVDRLDSTATDRPLSANQGKELSETINSGLVEKMDTENPTGTGSFSLNRKANTTVGTSSTAEGYECEASGNYSHAEGYQTKADSDYSHVEGTGTVNVKREGLLNKLPYQHIEGKYNSRSVDNIYGGTPLHVVGNGTDDSNRSNAYVLDDAGNAWFKGDVYVEQGGNGNCRNAGSMKLMVDPRHNYINPSAGQVLTLDSNLEPTWQNPSAGAEELLYVERVNVVLKPGATSAYDVTVTLLPRTGYKAVAVVGYFLYRNTYYLKRSEIGLTTDSTLYVSVYNASSTSRASDTNESWFNVLFAKESVIADDA